MAADEKICRFILLFVKESQIGTRYGPKHFFDQMESLIKETEHGKFVGRYSSPQANGAVIS